MRTITGIDERLCVLFLCVANSARSQMAEGLARHYWSDIVRVQSAGSEPLFVNPYAIEVMKEIGIDISKQTSKSIDEVDLRGLDAVVTLCAENICPAILSSARHIHWPIVDPVTIDPRVSKEDMFDRFRDARDTIRWHLEGWLGYPKEHAHAV